MERRPLLVIDAANVVGSVPDGWWRNRRRATERLRDSLAAKADEYEVVLVVEGAARGVRSIDGVRVVPAEGSGDDKIVEVVRNAGKDRRTIVVTADRLLRDRVTALGTKVIGPRSIRR
jgi:rRNA-processing protein FCF1